MKQIDLSIVVNETFLKSYLNSINVNNSTFADKT